MTSLFASSSWTPDLKRFSLMSGQKDQNDEYGRFHDADGEFQKVEVEDREEEGSTNAKPTKLQMEIPDDTEKLLKIIVPSFARQGEEINIDVGDGRVFKTVVPAGKGPGSSLWIPVPKKRQPTDTLSQMSGWLKSFGI
mmetsp:Transcript_16391/g.33651  ORF Transcript_16391/g.33651 Transcript_16391/m.33651 type:complete len:138 (+) Transcript_16391:42-455(+)